MRWGMVIDLTKCIGCFACVISCKQEHFLPPNVFWPRIAIGEVGEFPAVQKQVLPVLCNHCKEAPCQKVCTTGATKKREDGIVWVDYDKCVGCRYCVIACPYQHRTYLSHQVDTEYFPGKGFTPLEELGRQLYPLQKGTVVKCNFCMERIDYGLKQGLTPGDDREATPACVNNCPVGARVFGDLEDPLSKPSVLIREKKGFQLHHEYGTDPSVWYVRY